MGVDCVVDHRPRYAPDVERQDGRQRQLVARCRVAENGAPVEGAT